MCAIRELKKNKQREMYLIYMYEGCSINNVICALFRGNRAIYAQNHLVSIELSLARDTGKYLVHTFTGLGTVYIVSQPIRQTIHKMTGKRAENVLETKAYIKGRSLLGIKAVDIHREVCDIYGEGQMSHRTVCRWVAKSSAGQQQLKDAARPGRPATTTTIGNIEKIQNILKTDARFTVRQLARMTNLSLARFMQF